MDEAGPKGTISAPRLRSCPLCFNAHDPRLRGARGPLLTAGLRACAPLVAGVNH